MLLTTHFMDEADLLGDRIAIMAGGELQCCGSSFFLKKKYGAGYSLIMDKSKECDAGKVRHLLRKYIADIEVNTCWIFFLKEIWRLISFQIHSNVGSELTFLLSENESSLFEPMLSDLENNREDLGIRSYGISLTTLEEVFMKWDLCFILDILAYDIFYFSSLTYLCVYVVFMKLCLSRQFFFRNGKSYPVKINTK